MTLSFEQLTRPQTVQECTDSIYIVLDRLGVSTTGWKSGGWMRTLIAIFAAAQSQATILMSGVATAGFKELSSGDWLTITAKQIYNVDRVQAGFASGSITINNTLGGTYSLGIGDITFLNPITRQTYVNTDSISIGSHQTGIACGIQAVTAGSAGSAAAGSITSFVTPLLGLTCSNPLPLLGADAQSDASLRQMCNNKLDTLSPNGAAGAYAYVATTTLDGNGALIPVTRVAVDTSSDVGVVNVWLATDSGTVPGTVGDLDSQLGIVEHAMQMQCVPLGVTAIVASATPVVIDVIYQAWSYTSSAWSSEAIKDKISDALVAWIANRPIGGDVIPGSVGRMYYDALVAQIDGADDSIFHVVVTQPSITIEVAPSQVLTLGTITGTITAVSS